MIDERWDKVVSVELISPRYRDIPLQVLQAEIVVRSSVEDVKMDVEAARLSWLLKVGVNFTEGLHFTLSSEEKWE